MMNGSLIWVFGMATRGISGFAIVVSASLMFAGTAQARDDECKKGDTWCGIKQLAGTAKDVAGYFSTAVDIGEAVGKAIGLIENDADRFKEVEDLINEGFRRAHWHDIVLYL